MDELPRRIRQYTVIGVLGEGGTGKVYLAEQTEPLRRTVAIKMLEAIEHSDRVFARFEVERTALAVMDHPSIAKVYDAGITDEGHPFVVMERVDGLSIGQYCDERRLTIRERVELFAEACRAVHHAHQKGLIHRDLKPSHMLVMEVDGRPRLRIIDFGIAIALERDSHLDVGRDDEEIVGTPGYMSPEQMEGSSDIDTRTDIYSLGVILYELLVGVPPFESGKRRGWAAVAAQLEDLPTPTRRLTSLEDTQDTLASHRRTTPRGLRKALSGDLDSIVTRAMSKDRVDRYETAKELWLDLERYLAFEPVEARGGGPAYRAGRFARRHRLGVAFGGVVAAGLIAFLSTSAVQAARVARARDEAEARRSQAEALIDFMLTDLRDRLEPLGRLDVLDAVGDQALAYLSATPEQDIDDEELFRRVTTMQQIGQVRLAQGDLAGAQEAFDNALTANAALVARAPQNGAWQVGLGASHFYVGIVHRRRGEAELARAHMEAYRDVAEQLVARDATNQEWQIELAYSHNNLGMLDQDAGDFEGALEEFTETTAILQRVSAAEPENDVLRVDLADRYNAIGYALQQLGRLREALADFQDEVRIKQNLVEEEPSNTSRRARLATGHNYLGQAFEIVGQLDSAMAHYGEAVQGWTALVAHDPTNTQWRRNLGMNEQRVGRLVAARGDPGGALARLRTAMDIKDELATMDPADPSWRRDQADIQLDVARALLDLGRSAEALTQVRSAQSIMDELPTSATSGRDAQLLNAEIHDVTGTILTARGDGPGAREAWEEALRTIEPLAIDSENPSDLVRWVRPLLGLDRIEEARPLVQRLEAMGYRNDELAELAERKGVSNSMRVTVQ